MQCRRRAHGHWRADRHVHAGAGALWLGRTAPRIPGARDCRRHGGLHRRERGRRRLRRGRAQDRRPERWRRLHHQRLQDVDHQRHAGRLVLPAGQHLRRPGAQEQVADHGAARQPGRHAPEDPQDRHGLVRHRAAVLRQRAGAAAQPDRPGGHGLHVADAAVPGRAAVWRCRLPALARPPDRPDHRLHAPAPDLWQADPAQPGGALPPGRAAHRGRGPARPDLPRRGVLHLAART